MSGQRHWQIYALAIIVLCVMTIGEVRADVELRVARFFDPCIEPDVTIEDANGEACIIHAILDEFSDAENGVTIGLLPSYGDSYYPQLVESYSSNTPPDIHILHRHRLSDFAGAGMLASLEPDLSSVGIDVDDWEPEAVDAVTIDDNILAVPFDLHANLWHVNLALLREAGLVGRDGRPDLPTSPGELIEHAQRLKEVTGEDYLAADFVEYPIGMRAVLSLFWQQNKTIVDGPDFHIDSAAMRAAITTFTDLFDADLADPMHDYESAQQAFLNGNVAILINGTWAVDLYDRLVSRGEVALSDYDVANFPTLFEQPATWADLHVWAIPATLAAEHPEKYEAALKLLSWINDHNLDWARTGHLAVRSSVLESRSYQILSHRPDYRNSIALGYDIPLERGYDDVHTVLMNNLQTIWRDGRSLDEALAEAEGSVRRLLQ